MSDVPLPHAAETPPPVAVSALKQAREQAGLHVVALAALLKVPVNKLEALEAGRYSDLPDLTFARALAKSVCRQLKIDPAPILASLPQGAPVDLGHLPKGLNTAMPGGKGTGAASLVGRQLPWPWVVASLLAVLAGVLWWAVPPGSLSAAGASKPEGVEPVSALEPAAPVVAPVAAPPAAMPTVVVPAPAPTPMPTPEVAAPTTAPVATAGLAVLQLRATQTAWVEVVGRSGRLLIQRTLQAGETVSFQDDAPYAVVTGRADATEVVVRGQAFDLAPVVRNNVARFQVQ